MVTEIKKCTECNETDVDQDMRDLVHDLFGGHVRHVFDEFIQKREERLGTWPSAPDTDQMIQVITDGTLMPMCSKCFMEKHRKSSVAEWAAEALKAPEDSPLFFVWKDITDFDPGKMFDDD